MKRHSDEIFETTYDITCILEISRLFYFEHVHEATL